MSNETLYSNNSNSCANNDEKLESFPNINSSYLNNDNNKKTYCRYCSHNINSLISNNIQKRDYHTYRTLSNFFYAMLFLKRYIILVII